MGVRRACSDMTLSVEDDDLMGQVPSSAGGVLYSTHVPIIGGV